MESSKKVKNESKSAKAGLIFPVSRFHRYLRKANKTQKVGTTGAVYLSAVLEYLTSEMLELSGDVAKVNKKVRIIPKHLELAIRNDAELNELLKDVTISNGGVIGNIHPSLLAKGKKKSTEDQDFSEDQ